MTEYHSDVTTAPWYATVNNFEKKIANINMIYMIIKHIPVSGKEQQ
jgi:polyphosphate kinase 2 (PPK2 family)